MFTSDVVAHALPGSLVVIAVSLAAQRARLLTWDGAAAALLVGGASVLAGNAWAALLLFFFLSSSVLSLWRKDYKRALLEGLADKGHRRDAVQVVANGGVFAIAAVASLLSPGAFWTAVGAGAIASATSDTWSTEVGTVAGGVPRHLLTGAPLPRGASGGITAVGSAAGLAGAATVAALVWVMQWEVPVHATIVGGVVGGLTDSLLGATVQERRWCPRCERLTERRVHSCGEPATIRGGLAGFGNDAVNLTSVIIGAVTTGVLT